MSTFQGQISTLEIQVIIDFMKNLDKFDATGKPLDDKDDLAKIIEKAAEERLSSKGVYANVDFYSGILYQEMGIPADQFTTIFAIARSAGWLAHWREQLGDNRIFRPTQVYCGSDAREYVAMADR